jgi:uncharacterized membrane protein YoaK (UPF0700 family)
MTADAHPNARDNALAALLAVACGVADAVGYLGAGIFAANMTGNTVLIALAVAQHNWLSARGLAITLAAFLAGAVIGRALRDVATNRPWTILLAEGALIGIAALGDAHATRTLWTIALAMGVQATAITSFRGAAVSTVVMTSTIAHLGEAAADRILGRAPAQPSQRPPAGLLALVWIAYGAGALVGGVLMQVVHRPLLAAAGLLIVAAALSARR